MWRSGRSVFRLCLGSERPSWRRSAAPGASAPPAAPADWAPHSLGGVSLAGTAAPACKIPPPSPRLELFPRTFRFRPRCSSMRVRAWACVRPSHLSRWCPVSLRPRSWAVAGLALTNGEQGDKQSREGQQVWLTWHPYRTAVLTLASSCVFHQNLKLYKIISKCGDDGGDI